MARILIVDDAAFMRSTLKQILTENGFEIAAEARTGAEAVQLYELHRPDLVTMDITMPDMDGIEAVRRIKAIDSNARIIMCSAMGHQRIILDAISGGAADFIVKPFVSERVVQAVRGVL